MSSLETTEDWLTNQNNDLNELIESQNQIKSNNEAMKDDASFQWDEEDDEDGEREEEDNDEDKKKKRSELDAESNLASLNSDHILQMISGANSCECLQLSKTWLKSNKNLYQIAFNPDDSLPYSELDSFNYSDFQLDHLEPPQSKCEPEDGQQLKDARSERATREMDDLRRLRDADGAEDSDVDLDSDGFLSEAGRFSKIDGSGQCNQSQCNINQLSLAEEIKEAEAGRQARRGAGEEDGRREASKTGTRMSTERSASLTDGVRLMKTWTTERRNQSEKSLEPNQFSDHNEKKMAGFTLDKDGGKHQVSAEVTKDQKKLTAQNLSRKPIQAAKRLHPNLCIINNPPGTIYPYSVKNCFCCTIV